MRKFFLKKGLNPLLYSFYTRKIDLIEELKSVLLNKKRGDNTPSYRPGAV